MFDLKGIKKSFGILLACVFYMSNSFASNNAVEDYNKDTVKYCQNYAMVYVEDHFLPINGYLRPLKWFWSSWEYLEREVGTPNEAAMFQLKSTIGKQCGEPVLVGEKFNVKFIIPKYEGYSYLISYKPNSKKYYYLDLLPKESNNESAVFWFATSGSNNSDRGSYYELINRQEGQSNYLDCKANEWCYSKQDHEINPSQMDTRVKIYPMSGL